MKLAALSEAIMEVNSAADLHAIPESMIKAIARIIPFDAAGYNEFDTASDHVRAFHTCGELARKLFPAFNEHLREHPTYHVISGGPIHTPIRWSDQTTLRQFKDRALYQDYFKGIGINYQLGIALHRSERFVITISLNRQGGDFSASEVTELKFLAPHLTQAFSRAREIYELRRALELHQEASEYDALTIVDTKGGYILRSEKVDQLFAGYFRWNGGACVPAELRHWLTNPDARVRPFCVLATDRELRVCPPKQIPSTLVNGSAIVGESTECHWLLRFREVFHQNELSRFTSLGLTMRESEILRWIAEGKRNSEIATIVGARPRTIEKHCENIFGKLGVENRNAATAMASEILAARR